MKTKYIIAQFYCGNPVKFYDSALVSKWTDDKWKALRFVSKRNAEIRAKSLVADPCTGNVIGIMTAF